ncbi:MAG: hypothetical protein M1819_000248 [Sarea resinae]|nr:MAG: hypothetical protein M1819_000248 [Sarea resinae]
MATAKRVHWKPCPNEDASAAYLWGTPGQATSTGLIHNINNLSACQHGNIVKLQWPQHSQFLQPPQVLQQCLTRHAPLLSGRSQFQVQLSPYYKALLGCNPSVSTHATASANAGNSLGCKNGLDFHDLGLPEIDLEASATGAFGSNTSLLSQLGLNIISTCPGDQLVLDMNETSAFNNSDRYKNFANPAEGQTELSGGKSVPCIDSLSSNCKPRLDDSSPPSSFSHNSSPKSGNSASTSTTKSPISPNSGVSDLSFASSSNWLDHPKQSPVPMRANFVGHQDMNMNPSGSFTGYSDQFAKLDYFKQPSMQMQNLNQPHSSSSIYNQPLENISLDQGLLLMQWQASDQPTSVNQHPQGVAYGVEQSAVQTQMHTQTFDGNQDIDVNVAGPLVGNSAMILPMQNINQSTGTAQTTGNIATATQALDLITPPNIPFATEARITSRKSRKRRAVTPPLGSSIEQQQESPTSSPGKKPCRRGRPCSNNPPIAFSGFVENVGPGSEYVDMVKKLRVSKNGVNGGKRKTLHLGQGAEVSDIPGPVITGSAIDEPFMEGPVITGPFNTDPFVTGPVVNMHVIPGPFITGRFDNELMIDATVIAGGITPAHVTNKHATSGNAIGEHVEGSEAAPEAGQVSVGDTTMIDESSRSRTETLNSTASASSAIPASLQQPTPSPEVRSSTSFSASGSEPFDVAPLGESENGKEKPILSKTECPDSKMDKDSDNQTDESTPSCPSTFSTTTLSTMAPSTIAQQATPSPEAESSTGFSGSGSEAFEVAAFGESGDDELGEASEEILLREIESWCREN